MNKEKVIFFGAITLVFLIMLIYGLTVFSKKDSLSAAADFSVPELVAKAKAAEDYNNRLQKANSYKDQEEKSDLSKSVDFKVYQSETKTDFQHSNTSEVEENKPFRQNIETLPPETKLVVKTEPKLEFVEQTKEESGGFGIVLSNRSNDIKQNTINAQVKNGGFFSAVLEEDTKIKNQSSVVFFLLEDCIIDGIVFKKNSILYGKALVNINVFDIHIYQIMNTDGNISSVSGLIVFDEKYSRGLAYEGELNESVKEGLRQSTNETSSSLTSNITSAGVEIAASAVDNTIKSITRKKEASVSLYKGYKVFIKKE